MNRFLDRDDLLLIGDGALITCGLSAGLTALVLLLTEVVWGVTGAPNWVQILSMIAVFGSAIGGPVLAWLASGRTITLPAVLGLLLGGVLSAVAFGVLAALVFASRFAFVWIKTEGPWSLVFVGALALIALAWVTFHLLKDTRADRRLPQPTHPLLNVLRIVAAVIVVVYTSTIVVLSLNPQSGELIEAIAFMLMGAVNGACLVAGSAILSRVMTKPEEPAVVAGMSAR